MPRYYFDLVDDQTLHDRKGVSLPDLQAAREYAQTFVREIMEAKPTLLGEPSNQWSVHVCNGKFEKILKIPFAEIVPERNATSRSVRKGDGSAA
jgi:hypothetical protein